MTIWKEIFLAMGHILTFGIIVLSSVAAIKLEPSYGLLAIAWAIVLAAQSMAYGISDAMIARFDKKRGDR